VNAPSGIAAMTARINEIQGLVGTLQPAAGAGRTASGTAFAGTLSQALTTSTDDAASDTPSSVAPGPATGERAVELAASYTGVPYLWGGTDPAKGLDCSGLVQLAYRRLGVELPRTSAQQARVGTEVASLADARPGDLVFFGSPVHHVGVYAGNGTMVDAPRAGKDVGVHRVWKDVTAIRRVLPSRSATVASTAASTVASTAAASVRTATATPAVAATATALTLNDLVAARRGYGPASPGGVLGQVGTQVVSTAPAAVTATTATTPATPAAAATTATGAAAGSAAVAGPYAALFVAAGREHGVDPALLSAIAKAESGYDPTARSGAGAVGLMQIMPGTARDLRVDPNDPAQAVDGAARLVARYLKTYDGRVDLALAAYNAGPGAVRRYDGVPPYPETTQYIRRVTSYWKDLR
jgi:cell wall-associated NlpC family hydrolase/soluble lytic murein transglycosylase-like protein